MKYLFFILLCLYAAQCSVAQGYSVKGTVTDTLNNAALFRASVVLIRTRDSVIESFTRTTANGGFELKAATQGRYILRITFPSFADYVDDVIIKKRVTEIGDVPMVTKEHLLQEFVLTRQMSAIKIKGDTTEYVADSFKVKDNATVEDLLKRLPGIQVDKNGQITAQGETVQKILVDGEEFFSDDPKVVTQGLQANAIDKVQVYDKKSDQAAFTGIDDGQKTKTINLELKENKKRGYFGKADAGGGTDGYYQDEAMVNSFKGNRQLSVFGIASNTDKVGLGWQDNDKFGSGNGETVITDNGEIYTTYSSNTDDDLGGWDGRYNGQGLPQTLTGGAHYADKWHEDKDNVTANYRYAMQDLNIDGTTTTQYLLPGNSGFTSQQHKDQSSKGQRHGIDLMYDLKTDSANSLKLTASAGSKNTQTSSVYKTLTNSENDMPVNINNRMISSNANAYFVNADLLFRRKFAKKGRTLSIDVKENYKDASSDGQLTSATNLFVADTLTGKTDTVLSAANQQKKTAANTLAFSAKATYTEPLSKVAYLELDYGVTVNNSTGLNYSYDQDSATGKPSIMPDSLYSSNFRYNVLSNLGGLNFKFVFKKVNFSFGSDVANASYLQTDMFHGDTSLRYNYVNLFPKANLSYKISRQTSLKLSYQGSTQQPSIAQIQPLKQNTDPLNVTVGNPGLKQQFTNKVGMNFNDYRVLTSRYIYGYLTFSAIENAISTKQLTLDGLNTTQYINVNGNYTGYAGIGGGSKIKKLYLGVGLQSHVSINRINNVISTLDTVTNTVTDHKNTNTNNNYTIGPYFNYDKTDKYEFFLEPEITYNDNRSTISIFTSSYWSFTCQFSGTVQLPKKFEVNSSVDVSIRQQTAIFTTNNNVVKWNAYVGKKLLKKGQLELRANIFDILNQNIGYSRVAQAGIIMESNYNTIRRYGMLQLIWNFTHTPGGAAQPPSVTVH